MANPETVTVMQVLSSQVVHLLAMALCLVCSAFCSAGETALFSLTAYERLKLRQGRNTLGHIADRLLDDPQMLLLTILLLNLIVNLTVFTLSGAVAYRLAKDADAELAATIIGVGTLLMVILFGEILPKAVACHLRQFVSQLAAMPFWVALRVLRPVLRAVQWAIVNPLVRVLVGPKARAGIDRDEVLTLLDDFSHDEDLEQDRVALLRNVVDMQDDRVWQVMLPRVALAMCPRDATLADCINVAAEKRLPVVLIYDETHDHVIGLVRIRRIGLEQPASLAEVMERVDFVPEQQRVDQLIHVFRQNRSNIVVVVDEYGGLAGLIRTEDVVEELLGKLGAYDESMSRPRLRKVRAGCYWVDGAFEIDDLCRHFQLPEPEEFEVATVGGLLMELLGHLPQPGERATYNRLTLQAGKVTSRRIDQVILFESESSVSHESSAEEDSQ